MDSEKKDKQLEKPDEIEERIRFEICILKDGTTIIGDVPARLIPVLKELYPDCSIENEPDKCPDDPE